MRPNRLAIGFSAIIASRVTTAPVSASVGAVGPPLVTITVSLPSTAMPCGPIPPPRVSRFA